MGFLRGLKGWTGSVQGGFSSTPASYVQLYFNIPPVPANIFVVAPEPFRVQRSALNSSYCIVNAMCEANKKIGVIGASRSACSIHPVSAEANHNS